MTASRMTALNLLDALVRIDSVNPGLDPAGAGEAQIAAHVAQWGRSVGLRVKVLEGTTGRPSVILRGGRDHGGRRLLRRRSADRLRWRHIVGHRDRGAADGDRTPDHRCYLR
jgi:acetylornithine deacetylase